MRFDLRATSRQKASEAIDTGCAVTFSSSPQLSAIYALDKTTLDEIKSLAADAASPAIGLPFGSDYFSYPDKNRVPRMFSAEQMVALYKALRDYVTLVDFYGAGQISSLPEQPVIIDESA